MLDLSYMNDFIQTPVHWTSRFWKFDAKYTTVVEEVVVVEEGF